MRSIDRTLSSVLIISALYPVKLFAQVVPDNTLAGESSKINSIDELRDRAAMASFPSFHRWLRSFSP